MPKRIFIDTGAFLALEDESDEHHGKALQFRDEILLKGNYEMITTSYILDETLTLIRTRIGIKASIDFSKKMRKSKVVKILPILKEVEEEAFGLFEKYDDKDFSFTDCVSFVIMREMGIREVFGFDRHFDQMKLVRKP